MARKARVLRRVNACRPGIVEVRTPEQIDLQALHHIRDRLAGQRRALMNQLRAFCLGYGLAMRVGGGGFHADRRRHLANAQNDLTPAMRGKPVAATKPAAFRSDQAARATSDRAFHELRNGSIKRRKAV